MATIQMSWITFDLNLIPSFFIQVDMVMDLNTIPSNLLVCCASKFFFASSAIFKVGFVVFRSLAKPTFLMESICSFNALFRQRRWSTLISVLHGQRHSSWARCHKAGMGNNVRETYARMGSAVFFLTPPSITTTSCSLYMNDPWSFTCPPRLHR